MAKLLGLLVAAEGFMPVAGRVYAQDGDGWVHPYNPEEGPNFPYMLRQEWGPGVLPRRGDCVHPDELADDHATSVITAESILAARGAECQ